MPLNASRLRPCGEVVRPSTSSGPSRGNLRPRARSRRRTSSRSGGSSTSWRRREEAVAKTPLPKSSCSAGGFSSVGQATRWRRLVRAVGPTRCRRRGTRCGASSSESAAPASSRVGIERRADRRLSPDTSYERVRHHDKLVPIPGHEAIERGRQRVVGQLGPCAGRRIEAPVGLLALLVAHRVGDDAGARQEDLTFEDPRRAEAAASSSGRGRCRRRETRAASRAAVSLSGVPK